MPSASPSRLIYVVDDDASIRMLVRAWLEAAGYEVRAFETGAAALKALKLERPTAMCLDVMMPGLDGIAVLERMRDLGDQTPVVVLTAKDMVETAVACMRLSALDYVIKPIDRRRLLANLDRAAREPRPAPVPAAPEQPPPADLGIIGGCPQMLEVFRQVRRVARSRISVFISGESGTGKELVASAIHRMSPQAHQPFVALNCGAIPESLQESELFGHEKGAFTGANKTRAGKFEQANGGSIFLDEVAELALTSQVRLLRVVQERRLERVGGSVSVDLDLRIISATHRPIREMAATQRFREDLYYRLVVYTIDLPPLRARGDDILLLAQHFLRKHAADAAVPCEGIAAPTVQALRAHTWPGNVRELENVIHAALVRSDHAQLGLDALPHEFRALELRSTPDEPNSPEAPDPAESAPLSTDAAVSMPHGHSASPPAKDEAPNEAPNEANSVHAEPDASAAAQVPAAGVGAVSLQDMERNAIIAAVEACDGNMTAAAKQLGIGRATLYRKMERLGLR